MNKEQLLIEFEQTRPLLKSFVLRITASLKDTEDILQDTFIRASENLDAFKAASSIKTWLFTIGTNLAKDNLRAKKRWVENVTDIAKAAAHANPGFFNESMQLHASSPKAQFEIKEHITFCFTCFSKSLPLEQQICILLKEVYESKVNEIATILDTTEEMVKYYLHTGRSKMIDVFDGRCALINKQGVCHQYSELNGIYNPKQKFQEEVMKIDMAREAGNSGKERLFDLGLKVIQETDPFLSNASALQLHHLEHNRKVMDKYAEKTSA